MQLEVALLVVGLLKQNVSADAGVLQLAVVLDCGRCNVDVKRRIAPFLCLME